MKTLMVSFILLSAVLSHADIPSEMPRSNGGGNSGPQPSMVMIMKSDGSVTPLNPICMNQGRKTINISIDCMNNPQAYQEQESSYQDAALPRGRIFCTDHPDCNELN